MQHGDLTPSSRTKAMSCSTTTTVRSRLISVQQRGGLARSPRRSCRQPARQPAGASAPARAACRSPAIVSGRATSRRRAGRAACASRIVSRIAAMRALLVLSSRATTASRVHGVALEREARLSSTVWLSNTVGFWNLRPMPSSAMSLSSSLVRSMVPARRRPRRHRGRVLPVTTSIIVVLPAPLGPMMARISPGSIASERLFSAWKPSKRDGDAVEIEHRRRGLDCMIYSAGRGSVSWRRLRVTDRAGAGSRRRRFVCSLDQYGRVPTMPAGSSSVTSDEQAAEHEQPDTAPALRR